MRLTLTGFQHHPAASDTVLSDNRCSSEYVYAAYYSADSKPYGAATISADDEHDNAECLAILNDFSSLANATTVTLTVARVGVPTLYLFFDIER